MISTAQGIPEHGKQLTIVTGLSMSTILLHYGWGAVERNITNKIIKIIDSFYVTTIKLLSYSPSNNLCVHLDDLIFQCGICLQKCACHNKKQCGHKKEWWHILTLNQIREKSTVMQMKITSLILAFCTVNIIVTHH